MRTCAVPVVRPISHIQQKNRPAEDELYSHCIFEANMRHPWPSSYGPYMFPRTAISCCSAYSLARIGSSISFARRGST
ncbi:hypothetical protein IF2G_11087 [Cordyceps javanica]|nr:hypothetical protein IF2G_11087 [Cordyceps javanica]